MKFCKGKSGTDYIYDVDNLRVGKTENVNGVGTIMDVLKRFTYDGQNILSDGTVFYLNNIGVNSYEGEIYGDRNVAYLKDAVGTVRGELYDHPIVNKLTGAAFNYKSHSYTAFGEQMGLITNDGGADDVKDGVSFQGSYFDSESNLYYSRARYLDPSVGRWLTRDSFEDYSPAGLNKYMDCANNPVRYVDPMGQDFFEDVGNFFTGVGNAFVNGLTAAMGTIGSGFGYAVNGITAGVGAVVGLFNPEAGKAIMTQVAENISRLNTGMNYMWNIAMNITDNPMALSRDTKINTVLAAEQKATDDLAQMSTSVHGDRTMQDIDEHFAGQAEDHIMEPSYTGGSQPMQLIGDQINVNNTTDNGKPKTMNDRADEIFYQLHPELSGIKIGDISKSNPVWGRQLAFEWQEIRNGIEINRLPTGQQQDNTYGTLPMLTSGDMNGVNQTAYLWNLAMGRNYTEQQQETYLEWLKNRPQLSVYDESKMPTKDDVINRYNLIAKLAGADAANQYIKVAGQRFGLTDNPYGMTMDVDGNPIGGYNQPVTLGQRAQLNIDQKIASGLLLNTVGFMSGVGEGTTLLRALGSGLNNMMLFNGLYNSASSLLNPNNNAATMSGILSGQGGNAVDWYILNQAVKGSPVGNAIPWVGTGLNALSAASYAYDYFANGNGQSGFNAALQSGSVVIGAGASGIKAIAKSFEVNALNQAWKNEASTFGSLQPVNSVYNTFIKYKYEWATPAVSSSWDLISGYAGGNK
jgi:RHS repeat-associated protein